MERWRRKGDKCNQEIGRANYNSNPCRKPPVGGNPNRQPSVPYWEKRFVSIVGSLSWKRFLEAKQFTYLYDDVLKWDDSAGKEAFDTTKSIFHAKFHGLPCDEQFHDPDLYIDKIDWNAEVDHGLIQDFDNEYVVHDDGGPREPVVIFDNMLPDPYKDFSPYGWGDSDDVKKVEGGVNWDDYIDNNGKINWDNCEVGNGNNVWWDWNENDNKEGDQGWNTNGYDNNNNNYYYYYACNNVNNRRFHGNNNYSQRRNNGNWRKSTGQRYESQRSTFQGRGSQRVRVHQ